jgi:hypothetical protein
MVGAGHPRRQYRPHRGRYPQGHGSHRYGRNAIALPIRRAADKAVAPGSDPAPTKPGVIHAVVAKVPRPPDRMGSAAVGSRFPQHVPTSRNSAHPIYASPYRIAGRSGQDTRTARRFGAAAVGARAKTTWYAAGSVQEPFRSLSYEQIIRQMG